MQRESAAQYHASVQAPGGIGEQWVCQVPREVQEEWGVQDILEMRVDLETEVLLVQMALKGSRVALDKEASRVLVDIQEKRGTLAILDWMALMERMAKAEWLDPQEAEAILAEGDLKVLKAWQETEGKQASEEILEQRGWITDRQELKEIQEMLGLWENPVWMV